MVTIPVTKSKKPAQRKWLKTSDLKAVRHLIEDGENDAAISLIDTMLVGHVRGRKPGQTSAHLTEREFNEAVHGDEPRYRGTKAFSMNIEVIRPSEMFGPEYVGRLATDRDEKVAWTCPLCGHRNIHLNTGRGVYVCINCDLGSDVKVGAPKSSQTRSGAESEAPAGAA